MWLPDGNIQFLGRMDHQVKIRGVRVEIGEIENQLRALPTIKEAAVKPFQDNNDEFFLCAYVVPRTPGEYREATLRDTLAQKVPESMVPAYVVQLEKMPLTEAGKIDRKQLSRPEITAGTTYAVPTNDIERQLPALWAQVLAKDEKQARELASTIGMDDNFFQLGGHSLKAVRLCGVIHKTMGVKIPLEVLFQKPTIRDLARNIQEQTRNSSTHSSHIPEAEEREYYPMSSPQKRLYLLQQMDATMIAYNMAYLLEVEGTVIKEKWEEVFKKIIQRHESLRTSFLIAGHEPVQRIHPRVPFHLEFLHPPSPTPGGRDEAVTRFIQPFDLSLAPLLRVGLMRLEENKHLLVLDMHHIISDGVSAMILIKEFTDYYNGKEPPPPRIHYKEYALWQNSPTGQEEIEQQEKYWLQEFAAPLPDAKLPLDFPRPHTHAYEGNILEFEIDAEQTTALKKLAQEEEVTLFMLLLAIYMVLLRKISGGETVTAGTAAAGRRNEDLQPIVGMFVNTLAVKTTAAPDTSFKDFLKQVKKKTLKAYENQDYPFETLVEKTMAHREPGRNPIFDAFFMLQNIEDQTAGIPGITITPLEYDRQLSQFDFYFVTKENGGTLPFKTGYRTNLFKQETMERFIKYYRDITTTILSTPHTPLKDIKLTTTLKEPELKNIDNIMGDFGF